MPYTKIVVTIGPATCDRESLLALADAGMSVARLNGSHADTEWHRAAIEMIRSLLPNIPILLDVPGRKIRTILLAHEPSFAAGDRIVLTTDISFDGFAKVPVNYISLHVDVKPGDIIIADDGTLRFTVEAVEGSDIICRAGTCGTLRSRKGINVPSVKLNTSLITDRDRQMVAFAKELEVDFIGVSFVESAQHVHAIRELVGSYTPQIVAKIENQSGMDHLQEIVDAADAIMIDRGDLSVETRLETLVIYQKRIIDIARSQGKPVIVATEMLHSMIENDFPTKAEVADITNAVLDGCSATMLSGETALGRFPVTAVQIMRRIAEAAFQDLRTRPHNDERYARGTPTQAMEDAIAMILRSVPVTKVVAVTRGGYAARMLSVRCVSQPIFAISDDEAMARSFNLYSGVEGVYFDAPFPRGSADHIKACIKRLYELKKLDENDVILVTGVVYPRSGTRMNLIHIHNVSDLIDEFAWQSVAALPDDDRRLRIASR
jgi:pyruvate kinase